jgi:protoheme IX farnesyltransferase
VLEVLAFAELWAFVNLLSAVLALSATLFYVFVYTLWLKRTSTRNIVIGGAAGAVPVLVGWAAVTGTLAWAPVVMFLAIFLWTPPHFWALAIRYADDYRRADVPMLPAVATVEETSRRMLGYTIALAITTLVLVPVAHTGWIYAGSAFLLGGLFIGGVLGLRRQPTPRRAMQVFGFSITYVTLLFSALALDTLVRNGL